MGCGLRKSVAKVQAKTAPHDTLKRLDVQQLIRGEVGAAPEHVGRGHPNRSDNVTPNRGNNPTYTLKRLKRDRPDLADKVIAGEMSANAAALAAGFRKKLTRFDRVSNGQRASPMRQPSRGPDQEAHRARPLGCCKGILAPQQADCGGASFCHVMCSLCRKRVLSQRQSKAPPYVDQRFS
jgi:hypothetical protein